MANPTTISWIDPTTNTDGSAIAAGEITGYLIGVRLSSGVAGTYAFQTSVAGPAAANELISSLSQVLAAGSYAVAVQAVGPVSSAWSAEATFTIAAPIPNPPTGLTVK